MIRPSVLALLSAMGLAGMVLSCPEQTPGWLRVCALALAVGSCLAMINETD